MAKTKDEVLNGLKGLGAIAVVGLAMLVGQCEKSQTSSRAPDDATIRIVARQRLKDKLRDPDSLQIIEEKVIRPGKYGSDVGYWCKYRAKNGFGGYTVEESYDE
ncbi:MAG: hypothetical protein AABX54_04365 [Nanoarchaeota archaeon]